MLKKKNILIALVITLFFLIIAFFTTFRLAIYAFVICYIAVIIAKARNKRLKVPVVDFFVLTFFVGIIFAFIYSYSPRIQYYEFLLLHSRWEISKVSNVESEKIHQLVISPNFRVGNQVEAKLFFEVSQDSLVKVHNFNFYQTNMFQLIKKHDKTNNVLALEINKLNNNQELYVFKKPNKNVYKVFEKGKLIENLKSESNFIFAVFFLILFIYAIFFLVFNLKSNLTVLLNQYPKRAFKVVVITVFYVFIYSILTFMG